MLDMTVEVILKTRDCRIGKHNTCMPSYQPIRLLGRKKNVRFKSCTRVTEMSFNVNELVYDLVQVIIYETLQIEENTKNDYFV